MSKRKVKDDDVITLAVPLTKEQEDNLMRVVASLGKTELVVEVQGKRQVLRVVRQDAEGRELLEE